MTKHEGLPIPGLPGYAVDAAGVVWSGDTDLTQVADRQGYLLVRVVVNGRRHRKRVHQLVATVFHGPKPSSDHEVRHLNGDPSDNRAGNLAWGTRKENAADRDAHGRTSCGPEHGEAVQAGWERAGYDPKERFPKGHTPGPWEVVVTEGTSGRRTREVYPTDRANPIATVCSGPRPAALNDLNPPLIADPPRLYARVQALEALEGEFTKARDHFRAGVPLIPLSKEHMEGAAGAWETALNALRAALNPEPTPSGEGR